MAPIAASLIETPRSQKGWATGARLSIREGELRRSKWDLQQRRVPQIDAAGACREPLKPHWLARCGLAVESHRASRAGATATWVRVVVSRDRKRLSNKKNKA